MAAFFINITVYNALIAIWEILAWHNTAILAKFNLSGLGS